MIFLELSVLGLQDSVTFLKLCLFCLQTLELLGKLGELSLDSISGLGGIGSLAFHHSRVLAKNQKIVLLLSHSFLELGIFFFGFCQPLLLVLCSFIGG
jgi:hypothetical protein